GRSGQDRWPPRTRTATPARARCSTSWMALRRTKSYRPPTTVRRCARSSHARRVASSSAARVAVVHVRYDEPAPVVAPAQGQGELADVRLALVAREAAEDVAGRALGRVVERVQRERTARSFVVLLDRGPAAHRRRAAREHEPVLGEERGQRGRVLSLPRVLVVGQHAGQGRRQGGTRGRRPDARAVAPGFGQRAGLHPPGHDLTRRVGGLRGGGPRVWDGGGRAAHGAGPDAERRPPFAAEPPATRLRASSAEPACSTNSPRRSPLDFTGPEMISFRAAHRERMFAMWA